MDMWIQTLTLCILVGLTTAWTHGLTRNPSYKTEVFPFPWTPVRRSAYIPCSFTGERCQDTRQCCQENDVCLTHVKLSGYSGDKERISTCENMKDEREISMQLKPAGQICSSSMECADFCCREVRGHRTRYQVCGTPEDEFKTYTCIKASRSVNGVLDNLI